MSGRFEGIPGFRDWPPFLAITSKKIVLVSSGCQYTLYKSDTLLYGLTWDSKHLYVSTRHDSEEKRPSVILQFDHCMELVGTLPVTDLGRDVHQLLAWNGQLYICNTDYSNLIVYDLERRDQIEIRWTHDDVHINSIWRYGGIFYVLEHRHNHTPKAMLLFNDNWKKLATLPIHTGTQTPEFGYGVHDIYLAGGFYTTLGPYAVFKIDTASGEAETIEQRLDGVVAGHDYLRGLAALPEKCFLIGVSRIAPQTHRGEGNARVLLTDPDFNVLDEFTLRDVGQVCTIRLLHNDLAHHGLPCPYQPD